VTRRLRVGAGLAVATLATVAAACHPSPPSAASSPPLRASIVFVLVDDLDYEPMARLPGITALVGDRGAIFDHAYVSLSLCCPSRSTLLRGQYAHGTGIFENKGENGGWSAFHRLGDDRSTIATWLQADGYRTAMFGKYLNGYPRRAAPPEIPPGWTRWAVPVRGHAYDEFDYTLDVDGVDETHGDKPEDYLTDVLADKAERFVTDAAADKAPYMLWIDTYAPHGPSTPAPRHAGEFAGATAPRGGSFDEADVSDKPHWQLDRIDPRATKIDQQYRKRLQSMLGVQELVQRVVTALDNAGALDSTYIVFMSDNGYHLGQHRLPGGKNTPFEEDLHVPLQIRGPGIAPGTVVHDLVVNTDLAPTFAAIAGVATPDFVDGRSLLPLVVGPKPTAWRTGFLLEHAGPATVDDPDDGLHEPPEEGGDGSHIVESYIGVRTDRWKYVAWDQGEEELYDLQADPFELDNLARTAPAPRLAALRDWAKALQACAGATCRSLEDAPPREVP
jgi:N-acetylglucosamine-6-sulfatase